MLGMPLLREGICIGVMAMTRSTPEPFTARQIELVTNFAAQAVIAIENTRLLKELRESLLQQTATADVLKVISRSTFDLQTVLDTLVRSAARLCDAEMACIVRPQDDYFTFAANFAFPQAFVDLVTATPISAGRGTLAGRVMAEAHTVHIPDVHTDPDYTFNEGQKVGGFQSLLGVPLLREGMPIGVIVLTRRMQRPFTEKQIELVTIFADQAVIAIENVRLFEEVQARTEDLSEALEQQTATSEVLKVISGSPGELEPVFRTMLENATRICEAQYGMMFFGGNEGRYRVAAMHGAPPRLIEQRQREPVIHPAPGTALARLAQTKQPVHIADVLAEKGYLEPPPGFTQSGIAAHGGARTELAVPMLKDDELVGSIVIYRQEVRPFADKQIELVTNFAAQAVIAIENTRLLNELHLRTDDLSEALERQIATSEVLSVISSSPGELAPVFRTILENATRICDAKFGTLFRYEGEMFHRVAGTGTPPAFVEFQTRRGPFKPETSPRFSRMMQTKAVEHTVDELEEPIPGPPATLGGARSVVSVPMLKDNELVGAIIIYRQEVRPFTDKQIELVQNFAAQGVIAIENTRLLNELRQSLQQQTATAEVLKVISRSTFDLRTVLDTLTISAARLCEADMAALARERGDAYYYATTHNFPAGTDEFLKSVPHPRSPGSVVGRTLLAGKTIQIADVLLDPQYTMVEIQQKVGFRTVLGVPLLREGHPIGVIVLLRTEVQPFTDKQIELLQTFADQAVIAIENVRLFDEVQQRTAELTEALEQQTATSEVLRIISSSPGELEPVFDAMLENSVRICEAKFGVMFRFEDSAFYPVSMRNLSPALDEFLRQRGHREPNPGSDLEKLWKSKKTIHTIDLLKLPNPPPPARLAGGRTQLAVPMLMDDELVGAIIIYRQEVRPFTDKQIELVQNFAAQAVIAVENTRLLKELRQRTDDL